MEKTTKQKADQLVENVQLLTNLTKLLNEKLEKTNQWHSQQNTINLRFLIFISVCSIACSTFLGLIYVSL